MKKNRKRKLILAEQYDLPAIEKLLEREAEKGWILIRANGLFYTFEASEPKQLHYQIDALDIAWSKQNSSQAKEEYIDICMAQGWSYVCSNNRMHIFCSELQDPVAIQTDPKMKLNGIAKTVMGVCWLNWIVIPLLWLAGLITNLKMFFSPVSIDVFVRDVASPGTLGQLGAMSSFILMGFFQLIPFLFFYFRNKKRAERGQAIRFFSERSGKLFTGIKLLLLFLTIAMLGYSSLGLGKAAFFVYLAIICISIGIYLFPLTKSADSMCYAVIAALAAIGAVLCIAFFTFSIIINTKVVHTDKNGWSFYSFDDIGLTLEELGMEKPEDFLYEERKRDSSQTFLAKYTMYENYYYRKVDKEGSNSDSGYQIYVFDSYLEFVTEKCDLLLSNPDNDGSFYKIGTRYFILYSDLDEEINRKIMEYYMQ